MADRLKVLLTGCRGYIGSVAAPRLMSLGHKVVGLDTVFFPDRTFERRDSPPVEFKRRDVREMTAEDFAGFDAVVHMAELSNDPMGELKPEITYQINHQGSVRLAKLAKAGGVRRFVYMSSCSVYGVAEAGMVDETSPLNPQTVYAECKMRVEKDVGPMADPTFCPVFLRNATAFGVSPCLRLDLVLNNLCALAITKGEIRMTSDGSPWRPIVHISDISDAIARVLEAPEAAVRGLCLNVGANEQNYQVREIAEIVGRAFPGCRITMGTRGGDTRSYRVSFDKIRRIIPGYSCRMDAAKGAEEFRKAFESVELTTEAAESRRFIRMNQLKYLLDTRQVNEHLFWNDKAGGTP